MAETGVIGAGEEWRERRDERDGGEFEIALAVLGGRQFLHDASGSAYGGPAHAVFIGYHQAGVDGLCVFQDLDEEIGLRFWVGGVEHSGADGGCEFLLNGERVVVFEKGESLFGGEAFGVFGEGLRGDANGFGSVAAGLED